MHIKNKPNNIHDRGTSQPGVESKSRGGDVGGMRGNGGTEGEGGV